MSTPLPYLLYATESGDIREDRQLLMAGRSGWDAVMLSADDLMPLPEGSDLFFLPGRQPIGFHPETGTMRVCDKGYAVAAHVAPAHTLFYLSAFVRQPEAPTLPLYAYGAVGWKRGRFYVAATRIDADRRQEPSGFDRKAIERGIHRWRNAHPANRLVMHLAENCAMRYCCPAARNFFLGRYEAPLPVSAGCNSNCIGCISFQPEQESVRPSQERLTFKPTVDEVVSIAVAHLQSAPRPVVSFGQGCEGEPLLMWELIRESIKKIRQHTRRGIINLNTNGSLPHAVDQLCRAGLNSIRVSMNSAQPELYEAYYRPNNYSFHHLVETLKTVRHYGGWSSINYFVFPGVTDSVAEYEALRRLIRATGLNMIQWRNFNIDPDWYLEKVNYSGTGPVLGMRQLLQRIRSEFPTLAFGYFNPPAVVIRRHLSQAGQYADAIS
ncbi:MAG: radical SAM protein [Chitinophagales bacterium]|nr:radical SAM protein [Chitinophagales bacterium]